MDIAKYQKEKLDPNLYVIGYTGKVHLAEHDLRHTKHALCGRDLNYYSYVAESSDAVCILCQAAVVTCS